MPPAFDARGRHPVRLSLCTPLGAVSKKNVGNGKAVSPRHDLVQPT